jgi:hypothetical protein
MRCGSEGQTGRQERPGQDTGRGLAHQIDEPDRANHRQQGDENPGPVLASIAQAPDT